MKTTSMYEIIKIGCSPESTGGVSEIDCCGGRRSHLEFGAWVDHRHLEFAWDHHEEEAGDMVVVRVETRRRRGCRRSCVDVAGRGRILEL
ncbi:hypothetical protein E3N88_28581 [Mikania micrantha]|uniref:Uncharacterized protein n=1 Tax=Mikania micrantha TaxID=192012 RepID=A0A5N6N121_9ASTR|nr:hypothetical protein E3N88_28581 [Mikania micrantha]